MNEEKLFVFAVDPTERKRVEVGFAHANRRVRRIDDFPKKAPMRRERLDVNDAILKLWV